MKAPRGYRVHKQPNLCLRRVTFEFQALLITQQLILLPYPVPAPTPAPCPAPTPSLALTPVPAELVCQLLGQPPSYAAFF